MGRMVRCRSGIHRCLCSWVLLPWLAAAGRSDDQWGQFRGPTGQGHAAPQAVVPLRWSETQNVAWKTEIPGLGYSSPVVYDDQVWLTTASLDGRNLGAIGVDAASGRIVHRLTLFRPSQLDKIHPDNSYASPTPVVASGRLYCHFGRYGTACVDTRTGDTLWRNNELVVDHQGGPGSSPVPFDDLIVVNCDGADAQYTAALESASGHLRWKRSRSAPLRNDPITHRAFSTPLLIEWEGRRQLISPAADQIHAYDPATGEELWHVRYVGFSTVPTPVFDGGVLFFCTGYLHPQLWAVRVDGRGDVTDSHVLWKYRGAVPDTPSPIIVAGRVYTVSNSGVATVLNALTGERISQFRLGGHYSASPVHAAGRLYFCGEDGRTKVIDAVEKPKVIASNRLDGGHKASPAVLDHAIILRTDKALYRIEE